MAPSTGDICMMSLSCINRFRISLNNLVISCLIIAGFSTAQTYFNQESYGRPDEAESSILSSPTECARECSIGDRPRICYYHFTFERYNVLGEACTLCTPNQTDSISNDCQCVLADGIERTILTANRMVPGPSIQVCKGDKIVVDVKNQIEGMETSIHWHGLLQRGTQYYDGVPSLTQCSIKQGNTFRYQFMANNEGTHFWHSHAGLQKLDGLYGSLIVRKPIAEEVNAMMYDYDLPEHVIVMSDWMHVSSTERFPGRRFNNAGQAADSVLINGKGRYRDLNTGISTNTSLAVFNILPNQRYRFRLINAFCTVCPAEIIFQNHSMTLIAADGEPVQPQVINSLISFAGERYDLVLDANEAPGAYWIRVRAIGECREKQVQQLGILQYQGGPYIQISEEPSYESTLTEGVVFNSESGTCENFTNTICITDLRSATGVDPRLLIGEPDMRIYLPFNFFDYDPQVLFRPNTYEHFMVGANGGSPFLSLIDNISFTSPSSPPLSQFNDISPGQFCNLGNLPVDCEPTCQCTHKIDIPLDSVIEMILVDQVQRPELTHPFHLHGYTFTVMAMGRSSYENGNKISIDHVRYLDAMGLLSRIFEQPPSKDTIPVPDNGFVVFRFIADNPGYWLMHCHFIYHITIGMEVVLQVGNTTDFPPVPKDFPVCGDYLPTS